MKLARVRANGTTKLGALVEDEFVPTRLETTSMRELVAAAEDSDGLGSLLDRHLAAPLGAGTLEAPIDDPGKVVCLGLNYADHAAEGWDAMPEKPLVFAKFPTCIVGPGDPITWSTELTDAVDYEAELGVIIGRRARKVSEEDALSHVFGYTCLNDVTARDLQFSDEQWVRGKSLDTFCPIGPWIVTADEIPDPQRLAIRCQVSGEVRQDASTADMFFGVARLIAYLSQSFTLEPGDVIATGTPPGVGYFREPKRLLKDGDEVLVSIEGVGELRNPVAVLISEEVTR